MIYLGKCPQKPGLFLSWPLSQLGHPCLPGYHGQGCCFPLCWPKGHFAAPQPTCYLWVSPEYRFPSSHTISPTQSLFPWSLSQNPLTSALSIPLPPYSAVPSVDLVFFLSLPLSPLPPGTLCIWVQSWEMGQRGRQWRKWNLHLVNSFWKTESKDKTNTL